MKVLKLTVQFVLVLLHRSNAFLEKDLKSIKFWIKLFKKYFSNYFREYAERLTKSVEERMKKHLAITEIDIPEIDDESGEEEEEEEVVAELPEITPEMQSEINR